MSDQIQQYLSEADPVLKGVMDVVEYPEVERTANVFHDLLSCIIEQQIHYRSTRNRFKNLVTKAGLLELTPDNFPVFEREALAEAKLNMRKFETIARIVDYFEQETPDWGSLDDDDVRKELGQIKGVGPWTIDMILLYTLKNRQDIFPSQDYHLKKVMDQLYPPVADMSANKWRLKVAQQWQPYRSIAVRYLLSWARISKQKPI